MGIIGLQQIFKDFNLFLLRFQEQIILFRLQPFINNNKIFIKKSFKGCSIDLKKGNDKKKKQLNKEVENIFTNCENNVDKLIEYLEKENIKVYRLSNLNNKLNFIREYSGIIPEHNGFKALLINVFFNKKFSFQSDVCCILDNEKINIYNLMKDVHYVYFMKNNYPGFDSNSLKLLNQLKGKENEYLDKATPDKLSKYTKAVAAKLISMNFVTDYARKSEGAREAFNKIQTDNIAV